MVKKNLKCIVHNVCRNSYYLNYEQTSIAESYISLTKII
jgi:hypothetical protein